MCVPERNIFAKLVVEMRLYLYVYILNHPAISSFVYIWRFYLIGGDLCTEPRQQLNLTTFWLKYRSVYSAITLFIQTANITCGHWNDRKVTIKNRFDNKHIAAKRKLRKNNFASISPYIHFLSLSAYCDTFNT